MEKEMDNKAMLRKIETALSYYDMVRNAQKKYYEKQRDKKKADGVYRGRGRPRKEKETTVSPSLAQPSSHPPSSTPVPASDPEYTPSAVPSQVVVPQTEPFSLPAFQSNKRKVRLSASV